MKTIILAVCIALAACTPIEPKPRRTNPLVIPQSVIEHMDTAAGFGCTQREVCK